MEITRYNNISEASRELEIDNSTISYRLKTNNEKPLQGYQFKIETDRRPWLYFTQEDYVNSLSPYRYPVSARNLLTGEIKEFPSATKACEYFKNSKITSTMPMGKQPLLSSGWQLRYSHHEWEEIEDFEKEIYRRIDEITGRNEVTKEIFIGSSAQQLATFLGFDRSGIRKAALTRGNKLYRGYRFRLGISSDPWPETINN